jgi:hypothetical protein
MLYVVYSQAAQAALTLQVGDDVAEKWQIPTRGRLQLNLKL